MRRILGTLVLAAAAVALVAFGTGAKEDERGSVFRVEFDNAFGLVEGGDFKVAGVSAGKISAIDLDRRSKRAVVSFEVTEDGFGSLREDATCEIAPQSLVGEYFVDCQPGRSRTVLDPGEIIPVERTTTTVPPDLVANIMRRPYRERLSFVVNELGAAVAGNGENLQAALRRANPALRETNRVLRILADQNEVLADLARDADRVVGDLAEKRGEVTRWVTESRDIAQTSASRDRELAAGFQRLPTFLRELRPTMADLRTTVDEQGPALQNLAASAGQLERLFDNLPELADAGEPGIESLGEASKIGREAVSKAGATVAELRRYSKGVPELAGNLAIILEHLDDRRYAAEEDPRSPGGKGYTGLEALLSYVYDQTLSTNAHDGVSHFLKIFPFEGECAAYADRKAAKEKGSRCSTALGPNQVGLTFPDATEPKGYDGADRGGPEQELERLPVPIPLPRRRPDAQADEAPREERREEPRGDAAPDRPKLPETPKPPVEVPGVDEVVPDVRVPAVPEVRTPKLDPPAVRKAQEEVLDYLLGS